MSKGLGPDFGNTVGSRTEKTTEEAKKIALTSPFKIPKKAEITTQQKSEYEQIKYNWNRGHYQYTSRWHTRTPNAPIDQGNTWVVERKVPGIGYGKNQRIAKHEILVGRYKWISIKEWREAITAKKQGKATKDQIKILDDGHWKE